MHKFYIFPGNNSYLLREALLRRGNWQEETDNTNPFMECQFIWKPVNLSINEYIKLDGTSKAHPKNFVQVFNHFENIRNICTKTGLVRTLKKYYQSTLEARQAHYDVFDSTPTSFLITPGVEDREYTNFVARYRDIVKQKFNKEAVPAKHCETNMWLVKPANMNQGRGIEVFKNLNDINTFLSSRPQNSFWVVQKYVEKPLLYKARKFDIRVWVVVTAKNEIFIYNKSYIRTSSDNYDLKADQNYVHLTNNCLQQFGENYGKHEDGNTLPFALLDEYIKSQYPNIDFDLKKHIVTRIKDLIIDTILCTKKVLNPANRSNVFELFGYDFLIDEDLRTWLIEVNTNPYLGIPNKYIAEIMPQMLDDMLEIVLDPLIPPATKPRGDDRENCYELIYCDSGSAYSAPMNVRSQFSKNMYPIQSLIPPDFQKKLMFMQKGGNSGHHQNYAPPVKVATKEKGSTKSVVLHQADNTINKALENQVQETKVDEQKRASSVEVKANRPKEVKNNNSIEAIYKQLCLTMIYKSDINMDTMASQISRVLSLLTNWEIMSNKEVSLACKTLKLMAESAGSVFLADQVNIVSLAKLLKSSNVKTDIKLAVIDTINILSKDINLKKRIICNHIVHNLIALCLASCDEKEIQNHSNAFLMATLKCLVNLGGVFNRKHYIPGETREANKLRNFFIAQGGIAAIWTIKEKSLDNEMKAYCEKNFLQSLEACDLEKQLQVLEVLSTMPKTNQPPLTPKAKSEEEEEVNEEGEDSAKKKKKKKKSKKEEQNNLLSDAIFYKTGEFWNVDKILANKAEQSDAELEKFLDFPKSILKKIPIETLIQDFSEYVKNYREEAEKKETQEKEKRQMLESENKRKLESKKKEMEDQRKLALETFERRVQLNLKKQQADFERRQKELEEMKVKEAEDRKKNIEYLMGKKAERERKQMKIREMKQARKQHENEDDLNQSDNKVSKIYMAKCIQLSGSKSEYNKVNVKQLSDSMLNKDSIDERGLIDVYSENNMGSRSPRGTMNEALKISSYQVSSPSHGTVVKKYQFLSPTATRGGSPKKGDYSLAVNNLRGNQDNAGMLNEFEIDGKNIEEKMNSGSSFKLPKIQKASRIMVTGKLVKSPYLSKAPTNDSILKQRVKSDHAIENFGKENV